MTQHIEEARKLLNEIFRFCATEDKARDIVAAALAAAEERGRIEERERIREWMREQRKEIPAHGWEFANAITKEPTP